jgi:hypothetical protein
MLVFWVVTPSGFVGRYQNFGETYCFIFSPEEEEVRSSETLISAYKSTRRHNSKDQHRRLQGRDNLKSHTKVKWSCTRQGGAWGEKRFCPYSFLTSALDGDEWSASRSGRSLLPRKWPPLPIVQEAGWAPEPVWTQRLKEKPSASVGDRTPRLLITEVVGSFSDYPQRNNSQWLSF